MRFVLGLCLLAAAMSSDSAFAASRGHRPNTAFARPASTGEEKSAVAPAAPSEKAPPAAAGGNGSDTAAPIDTSITVNQGHRLLSGKQAAENQFATALGKLIPSHAKSHPTPGHPSAGTTLPARNAVGALAPGAATGTARAGPAPVGLAAAGT
ncbi:MAG: hypothetical protein JO228_06435, partial [Xanthobacteraceae bacterium]|nr:hypothetical protein [Xanthobacteraceae bacterium]